MFGANNALVSWYALNLPLMPGRVMFGGGFVDVGVDHIEAWVECPDGVWEADAQILPTGRVHYRLSRFHPAEMVSGS